jgi:hypothetical protein
MPDIGFTLESKYVSMRLDSYAGSRQGRCCLILVASFTYRKQKYEHQKFEFQLKTSSKEFSYAGTDEHHDQVSASHSDLNAYPAGVQHLLQQELTAVLNAMPKEELSGMLEGALAKALEERAAVDKANSEAALKKIAELEKEVQDRMLFSVQLLTAAEDHVKKIQTLPLVTRIR